MAKDKDKGAGKGKGKGGPGGKKSRVKDTNKTVGHGQQPASPTYLSDLAKLQGRVKKAQGSTPPHPEDKDNGK